jgi:hypothetical protein
MWSEGRVPVKMKADRSDDESATRNHAQQYQKERYDLT